MQQTTITKRRREQRISRSRQADEISLCREVGCTDLLLAAALADEKHPLTMYFLHVRKKHREAIKQKEIKTDTEEYFDNDVNEESECNTDEPSAEAFARWYSLHRARRMPIAWPPVPLELERLGPKSVQVLLADPPWPYFGNGGGNLSGVVERHYKTPDISSLYGFIDVWLEPFLADDCVLLMWSTGPRAHAALGLMATWRFDYKNKFLYWLKTFRCAMKILYVSCPTERFCGSETESRFWDWEGTLARAWKNFCSAPEETLEST